MSSSIVIAAAARTPMGGLLGDFAELTASDLGSVAIKAVVERSGIDPAAIDEAIIGNVLSAGQGQAPARQAVLKAGLPQGIACSTVNKMCGSGMQAVIFGHALLASGAARAVLAGGMESMSNAPYLLGKARAGFRLGHGDIKDHMFLDGLEDAYERGRLMGSFAEDCARRYGFSREQQDAFALQSLQRAQQAIADGSFQQEIAAVAVPGKQGNRLICIDEQPGKARPEKIPQLKPAFARDGTVTAANSSSISDGAAALLLVREDDCAALRLTPLARIVGHARYAHEPAWFSTAPVAAMQRLLQQLAWPTQSVDLFEINEAFAVVTLAAMHDLQLPAEKVNVHGGACALGHPIGASGARILVTLLAALQRQGGRRGVASLCIGGGEATAVAVELM